MLIAVIGLKIVLSQDTLVRSLVIGWQRHKQQLNKYFVDSGVILALFVLVAALVSPITTNANNSPITSRFYSFSVH